jgi:hypothetical protein
MRCHPDQTELDKDSTMTIPTFARSTRTYWIVTAVLCLFIAAGALFDVAKTKDAVKLITELGYPEYFIRFIGVMKLLAVAAIVYGRLPRLKHWAYAALAFDTGGALFSHISAHSAAANAAPAVLGLVLVLVSYALYTTTLDPLKHLPVIKRP